MPKTHAGVFPLDAEIFRDTSDRQLLERFIAERDETAFGSLVQRHSRTVWSVCRRVLQHEQDAEDAFQAVFLVLARKAASIQKREAVGSWLYGVAYRTAMKARQLASRRRKNQQKVNEAKPSEAASSEAALRELQRLLDEEVQRLAEKYRAPFVLCCLEGMSKAEAAKELGWKEGTVSGRLARARKQLQARLIRRGVTLSAALTAIALVQNTAAAAVPAGLAHATASAASASRSGTAATFSPSVTSLAEAVLQAMANSRLPVALALLLALLLALTGTSLIAWHWNFAAEPPAAMVAPDPDTFLPPPVGLGTPIDQQVAAVAFSPDGKRLVTAGGKSATLGQLKFWDVTTGNERDAVNRIAGVRAMVFSPDGNTLATGDSSGTITLRDPVTGIDQMHVKGHTGAVLGLAFSPDGVWLVSTGADHKVKIWSAADLREHQVLDGHAGPVSAVAFFRQGRALVTASQDGTAKIWDLRTGAEKFTLKGHKSAVEAVSVSPDDRFVATAGADQTVRIWDAETGGQSAVLPSRSQTQFGNEGSALFAVAFSPDGAFLAGGGRDGMIRLWNAKTLEPLASLEEHTEAIWALTYSKNGVLASGSADGTAKLWPMGGKRPLRTLTTRWSGIQPIQAVAYAPDGTQLGVATIDKNVHLREAKSGDVVMVMAGHTDIVNCLVFSPDGATLATGSNDQTIKLWDRATGELITTLTGHAGGVLALVFSADGKTLVSAGHDRCIKVWNPATGKEISSLPGHDAPIHALAFLHDARTMASGSADRTIKIWDLADLKETMTLIGHTGTVRALAYSSAGALASGSEDGSVKLWNLADGTERLSLNGQREIWTLAFTAQGRTLVSGGKDSAVRVWDPVSGELRGVLQGHKGPVTALAIHPRGENLISGSRDTLLFRWQAGKFVAANDAPKADEQFVAFQDGGRKEGPAPQEMPLIFRQDFRGQKINEKFLKFTPADAQNQIKEEPQGLRISLPGENPKRQPTGVQTTVRIQGDFDIVLSYELLQADQPTKGNGIGVTLYLTTDTPARDAIQLGRVNRKDGKFYACSKMTTDKDGNRPYTGQSFRTEARAGKLRLVRQGAVVTFFVADDGGDGFRELYQCELGREDVISVRAAGDPGSDGSPPLEARLLDLEVRARPAAVPAKKYAQEFFRSFKGKADDLPDFKYRGLDGETVVQFEPDGLRITLPPGYPEQRPGTGVTLLSPVVGDFEITINFEILKETEPADAKFVTRLSLGVVLDTPEKNEGYVSRRMDEKGVTQFTTNVSLAKYAPGAAPKPRSLPTAAKTGRLRLVRTDSTLTSYVSREANGDFVFLKQYAFSTAPLKSVYIMASTGGPKGALDVRVTDLRMRADSLPGLPAVVTPLAAAEPVPQTPPATPDAAGSKPWLIAGLLIGVLIAFALAVALAAALFVRRGRQTATTAGAPAKKESAPPSIPLQCFECGKKLNVKPALAGKKIKCSQCGKAVLVPATQVRQPGGAK
jgi:RNA polymerase sigma factor (sigma-70 family)